MIFIFLVFLNVVYSLGSQSLAIHPDAHRTTQEMAIAHGYWCKNYTVATPDGYLLTLFRIQPLSKDSADVTPRSLRRPLILQHGLLDTSDTYLINENPSLAYMMADEGFDVWLPNFRGNRYSRRHILYDPKTNPLFWEFSVDEIISIDLRCIIEFIVKTTGYEQIHYIGHSMGAGSIIAAASEDPAFYGSHLRSVVALSPATCLIHSGFFAHFVRQFPFELPFESRAGELYIHDATHKVLMETCHFSPSACVFGLNAALGAGRTVNKKKMEVLVARAPDSTSSNVLRHLLQQTEKPGFFHFRRPLHGDPRIPYNLAKFPSEEVPIFLVGSKDDRMVSYMDVRWLTNTLNVTGHVAAHKEYEEIGHISYMIPTVESEECYRDLINFVTKHD